MWGGFALGAAVTLFVLMVLITVSAAVNATKAVQTLEKRVNAMQRHIMDRQLMEMLDDGAIFDGDFGSDEEEEL
jgi:hypothetical protein